MNLISDYIYFCQINNFDLVLVEEILIANKIKFLIKNLHESSLSAGWASPGAVFNERIIYIEKDKIELAKRLLKNHL